VVVLQDLRPGGLRIRRRARHRRGGICKGMAARKNHNSRSMGGIRAPAASSSTDWEGSGISEALGERAGVL